MMLVSTHLSKWSCSDFAEIAFLQSAQPGALDVSAGSFLGQVGPAVVHVGCGCCLSAELGGRGAAGPGQLGRTGVLPQRSCRVALCRLPSPVRLPRWWAGCHAQQ